MASLPCHASETGLGTLGSALFNLLFFACPEVSRDRVDGRLFGEFFVLCLFAERTPKVFGNLLQDTKRERRLAFGKKIDLQIKMIAALEGPICDVLADQNTGSQQDGFKPEHHRQQRKWIFIEPPRRRLRINPNPQPHPKRLDDEEIGGTYKTSYGMEHAMMKQESFLILPFDAEY